MLVGRLVLAGHIDNVRNLRVFARDTLVTLRECCRERLSRLPTSLSKQRSFFA